MLRIDRARAVDDWIRQALEIERVLATRRSGTEHVQRYTPDDRHKPRLEVDDLPAVGAVQPKPCLLDGIVGLCCRAKHPVSNRSQPLPMLFELPCQPVAFVHGT